MSNQWRQRHREQANAYACLAAQRPDVRAQKIWFGIKKRIGKSPGEWLELLILRQILRNKCPLCSLPFDLASRDMTLAPSIDQIVPGGGYVRGNVRMVHTECNRIKGRLSDDVTKEAIRQIMHRAYAQKFKKEIAILRRKGAWAVRHRELKRGRVPKGQARQA